MACYRLRTTSGSKLDYADYLSPLSATTGGPPMTSVHARKGDDVHIAVTGYGGAVWSIAVGVEMINVATGFPVLLKKAAKRLCAPVVRPAIYQDKYLKHFLKFVDLNSRTLLIVGLGRAVEVPSFLDRGCRRIVAIEPFPEIDGSQFGPKFELVVAAGESIPVEACSFDVVYSIASLEHMANPGMVVREMVKALKPDGVLYCSGGPFWLSAFGYHRKERFPKLNEPWFHVACDKEGYLLRHPELRNDPRNLKRINQIYDHPGYNRLPSQIYYDIAADLLRDHMPLDVNFHVLPETLLDNSPYKDLLMARYSKRDLLTKGFTLVMKKS